LRIPEIKVQEKSFKRESVRLNLAYIVN